MNGPPCRRKVGEDRTDPVTLLEAQNAKREPGPLHLIRNAGHLSMVAEPQAFAAAVEGR
jgi:pimeloyl-ACP methyl ester carboxylesterase